MTVSEKRQTNYRASLYLIFFLLIPMSLLSYTCLTRATTLRETLKGGFLLCENEEELLRVLDDFVLETTRGEIYQGSCFPLRDRGKGLRFSLLKEHGDFVKIRVNECPVILNDNVFWTFRLNAYDESPERFLSLLRSSLKKGKVSTEVFINPKTGQFEYCDPEGGDRKVPLVDVDCEKEIRTKGYIRADEYKAKILNQ